jgi:2-polyprenyl-6-methoxyphenol hydroxylase-like FAD-dependent oxidoreductase
MVKVLISGAGIAGLSLALRLRQRGLTPVVVERSPRLRDGGYMLGLSDPGLDAAERMGVADALRAARHMPRRLVYVDGDGRERLAIGGPALDRLVGERRFNLLRGDIERVLYERVPRRGRGPLRALRWSPWSEPDGVGVRLSDGQEIVRSRGRRGRPALQVRALRFGPEGRFVRRSAPALPPSCSTARTSPTRSRAPPTR